MLSGQMHERPLMWVGDAMTENFVSDRRDISLAQNQEADHMCDGISFSPFEIDVRQSTS